MVLVQVPRNVQFQTCTHRTKVRLERINRGQCLLITARNLRIIFALALEIEHFSTKKQKTKQTLSKNSLYSSIWGGWSWQSLISIMGENETFFLLEFRELLISIDYRGFAYKEQSWKKTKRKKSSTKDSSSYSRCFFEQQFPIIYLNRRSLHDLSKINPSLLRYGERDCTRLNPALCDKIPDLDRCSWTEWLVVLW